MDLEVNFYALCFGSTYVLYVDKPTFQDLLPYIEHVDNWKVLGTYLLPEKYIPRVINDIERSYKGNADDCRGALLSEYIKVGDVSWNKVIDSLEKSRYSNVAKMIKKDIFNS